MDKRKSLVNKRIDCPLRLLLTQIVVVDLDCRFRRCSFAGAAAISFSSILADVDVDALAVATDQSTAVVADIDPKFGTSKL